MDKFELHQKIDGKNAMQFMAELLEKNEKQTIEIERGKLTIGVLKQMNNRSRLMLDASKHELKERENPSPVDKTLKEIEEQRKKSVDLSRK